MQFDFLDNILLGFNTAVSPMNLLYCFFGVSVGMVVGIIPGLGALAAMTLLFPITFYLDPLGALIMMSGIWYGTTYGGSITTILLNLPGDPKSAVTSLDGYPMTKQGRAGVALFMTSIASFVGATIGILIMLIFSPLITDVAIRFSAPEYFALMILGLLASAVIASAPLIKSVAMAVLGVLVGLVGMDIHTGVSRMTFGQMELMDGVSLVAIAMGLFGVTEVLSSLRTDAVAKHERRITLRSMLPTREDMRRSWGAMGRGAGVGSFFGILPGTGPAVSAFMAYAIERRVSRRPKEFGNGAIEGIMGPETANNAADQTAFIPTLLLGVPGTASMALMIGIMMIHGITPGPAIMTQNSELFWGLIMSFWIGNLMLLILNIPFIGLWVRILDIPYRYVYPAIVMFVSIGAYSVSNSIYDVWMVLIFGILGYAMRITGFPAAPLLLGYILGPMMEENLRRALQLSGGDYTVLITRPISGTILVLTAVMLGLGIWSSYRLRCKERAANDHALGQ
ncbi:tripartite tricarboxylate transporter TctA family protein (plasmid) [Antarctobacter heliothermus]|uniref:Tripartite tricarboxylate transporter TctA family protein n=1 Tax=Antarctobacter heliothermus TaxID=74033 RepID=A0A222EBS0_9RHOB|nr:tripartite tricarboxylate transporter permease [Antarctobacter heliothermus]ASP23649.1 tripartite tricarboxylate transporter TctA family protein [Antarctobacter heliothermus]